MGTLQQNHAKDESNIEINQYRDQVGLKIVKPIWAEAELVLP